MSHKKKETKRSGGGDDQDIAAISEDELRLSRKEKLQEISDKFEELCSKCTAAGLGNASVRKLAGSFVGCREQNKRKTRERRLIAYFLVVALACAAFYCDTSYDWISAHARLASIQLIPYYDFTQHYNDYCLIDNPLYKRDERPKMNCDICTELGDVVETMPATEASSGLADYLEGYIPVIVKAALESWPAYKRNITVEDIAELYRHSPRLMKSFVPQNCPLKGPTLEFNDVLEAMASPNAHDSFTAVWSNCDEESYKEFRKQYRRATFLPQSVEASPYNMVFTSFGTKKRTAETEAVTLDLVHGNQDLAVWIGQISGVFHFTISPVAECRKCPTYNVFLSPGDFLLVPLELWEVSFRPAVSKGPDAIAIGSGIFWGAL